LWLDVSWLDVKLGIRMMVKYPGLTLVGGFGMAVAIAISGGSFDVFNDVVRTPPPPLDDVVAMRNWNAVTGRPVTTSLRDFATWRDALESVEDVGASRWIERNFITDDGRAEPVLIADITPSAFRLMRVAPLLGRPLVEGDAHEEALPVVVIGYDVWRTRFASDPAVVGRNVRLGSTVHTVVGVMPDGFAFPLSHHFWTPLRADLSDYERGREPQVEVFGRLGPGVTLDRAQHELTTIGMRQAAAFPETHEHLRPRISSYADRWTGNDDGNAAPVGLAYLLFTTLLLVPCANVAILVYARTATRQGELAVRNALGASRRRIVAQLFMESLVLATAAAAVALVLARLAVEQMHGLMADMDGIPPFWIDVALSSSTVLYVVGLTVLAAVVAGVLPAVQATGRRVASGLRQLGADTRMQLGRTWTVLIVAQVAASVAILPAAVSVAWASVRSVIAQPGFAAEEFLTARLVMDWETPSSGEADAYWRDFYARFRELHAEVMRRLEAEPAVSGVTYAWGLPGQESPAFVEVEGMPPAGGSTPGREVRRGWVDVDYFDVFDVPILAGRRFDSRDLDTGATATIVSRTFVRQILGDNNALGRRVRVVPAGDAEPGPWYGIVGVVDDLRSNAAIYQETEGRLYHPMAPGQAHPVKLALRVGSTPATFAGRFREITIALDPTLRLQELLPLDELYRTHPMQMTARFGAWTLALATLSVLFLSTAGIYALTSVTVTQRRREIGIRVVLGAHPHRILGSIFSRAVVQLVLGVAVGILGAVPLATYMRPGALEFGIAPDTHVVLPAVAALMIAAGLVAAIGPARRGLRIQPAEVLKEGWL
jgi:predicted permease